MDLFLLLDSPSYCIVTIKLCTGKTEEQLEGFKEKRNVPIKWVVVCLL